MPVYLIRHSRVVAAGLCYGQSDVPLADSFADEISSLRDQLTAHFGPQLPTAISSPSARCTALARALRLNAKTDSRLMELNFGQWEGKTWAEIDGPTARAWGDNWQQLAPPEGEYLAELISRVDECYRQLPAGDVLLICHAGPIRALWHLVQGLSLDQAFACPVPHASLLRL